jgi:hypothetical protein
LERENVCTVAIGEAFLLLPAAVGVSLSTKYCIGLVVDGQYSLRLVKHAILILVFE